jgi:hypothetical protein
MGGSSNGTSWQLQVLDGEDGSLLPQGEHFGLGQTITTVAGYIWGLEQRLVVGGIAGRVAVFDPERGELLHDLESNQDYIYTLRCAPPHFE